MPSSTNNVIVSVVGGYAAKSQSDLRCILVDGSDNTLASERKIAISDRLYYNDQDGVRSFHYRTKIDVSGSQGSSLEIKAKFRWGNSSSTMRLYLDGVDGPPLSIMVQALN